jgi:hypothetical protein
MNRKIKNVNITGVLDKKRQIFTVSLQVYLKKVTIYHLGQNVLKSYLSQYF